MLSRVFNFAGTADVAELVVVVDKGDSGFQYAVQTSSIISAGRIPQPILLASDRDAGAA